MEFLYDVNDFLMLDQTLCTIFPCSAQANLAKMKNNNKTTTRQDKNKPVLMTAKQPFILSYPACLYFLLLIILAFLLPQDITNKTYCNWMLSYPPELIPQNVDEIIPK